MVYSDEIENADEEVDEQPQPLPVRGNFTEIYNPVTRQVYIYRDGEWIPKAAPSIYQDVEPL
jgi:hypothetical protein